MQIDLTKQEKSLLLDLLRHRALKLHTDAAYVAYSSAWNNSPTRQRERAAQEQGAIEVEGIITKIEEAKP